jgi:hypothetical protein
VLEIAVRLPFVAEIPAPALVEAVERPELLLEAVAFFVAAAANTAST